MTCRCIIHNPRAGVAPQAPAGVWLVRSGAFGVSTAAAAAVACGAAAGGGVTVSSAADVRVGAVAAKGPVVLTSDEALQAVGPVWAGTGVSLAAGRGLQTGSVRSDTGLVNCTAGEGLTAAGPVWAAGPSPGAGVRMSARWISACIVAAGSGADLRAVQWVALNSSSGQCALTAGSGPAAVTAAGDVSLGNVSSSAGVVLTSGQTLRVAGAVEVAGPGDVQLVAGLVASLPAAGVRCGGRLSVSSDTASLCGAAAGSAVLTARSGLTVRDGCVVAAGLGGLAVNLSGGGGVVDVGRGARVVSGGG